MTDIAHRPRVLVDFDGVVHAYSRGWDDGTAYDEPMHGAFQSLAVLDGYGYEVVIFSSRDAEQITAWLERHDFPPYRVTNVKEPAVAQIDDRAIRFVSWDSALVELMTRYPPRR
jgi:hypothetical protein